MTGPGRFSYEASLEHPYLCPDGDQTMKRLAMVITLAVAQFALGCATQPTVLPRGEVPNRLVETIARRGQGEGPIEPEPPGSFLLADCLTTGAKVGAVCLFIPALLVYWGLPRARGVDSDPNLTGPLQKFSPNN